MENETYKSYMQGLLKVKNKMLNQPIFIKSQQCAKHNTKQLTVSGIDYAHS